MSTALWNSAIYFSLYLKGKKGNFKIALILFIC